MCRRRENHAQKKHRDGSVTDSDSRDDDMQNVHSRRLVVLCRLSLSLSELSFRSMNNFPLIYVAPTLLDEDEVRGWDCALSKQQTEKRRNCARLFCAVHSHRRDETRAKRFSRLTLHFPAWTRPSSSGLSTYFVHSTTLGPLICIAQKFSMSGCLVWIISITFFFHWAPSPLLVDNSNSKHWANVWKI